MASNIIPLRPPGADEHAQSETERKQALFDWGGAVLRELGVTKAVRAAQSVEELRGVAFDVNSAEVALAILAALHPATGQRHDHFFGMREGALRKILRSRFDDLKKTREADLKRRGKWTDDWEAQLILKDGKPTACLANLILILRKNPDWKDVIAWDEFNLRVAIRKQPPWMGHEAADAPWTDHHESQTRVWFQKRKLNPSLGDVGRAVQATAKHNRFHPVRAYLSALVWDGVPRLDSWITTFLHAEDTPYTRAVGPRYLISAVARVFEPGCQVDHMLVLEGGQGRLKSQALRALATRDDWFTDRLSAVASKDAAIEMSGTWIVEIAEMDALLKATSSATKAFLTRARDRFRPPYGVHLVNQPRQCVLAGTINPSGGYLTDPTDSRRFWPVTCVGMIDLEGLKASRDQLWAEAVVRYKAKGKWWLETPALEALATAEQAVRFATDAWQEPISKWLKDRTEVALLDVLKRALGFTTPEQQTQAAQKRVVAILTGMGFSLHRPRRNGRRVQVYQRDPVPQR
jgi:predicted P-loop ATPase